MSSEVVNALQEARLAIESLAKLADPNQDPSGVMRGPTVAKIDAAIAVMLPKSETVGADTTLPPAPPRADHMRLGIVEKGHVTLFLCAAGGEVIATAAMSIDICERLVIDLMDHVAKLELARGKLILLQ